MKCFLIKDIHTLVTMVPGQPDLHDVHILVEGGRIARIITAQDGVDIDVLAREPDTTVVDGRWCVVYPGFINMHHHLYQTLTRNIPRVQNAKLFDWLIGLYEVWRELSEEAVEVSTQIGCGELLLSGCTTTSDHFYVFPQHASAELLDVEIEAARRIGMRFHPTRGSMSRGRSDGGLPPDDLVQSPDAILADCDRIISKYHDPDPFSLCRIILAPCSPFSVTTELLEETAQLARQRGVRCHTHLCETIDEEAFCLETHGMRPLAYMEKTGWVGEDVWFAHGIYFNEEEIRLLADTKTGISHCPSSNLRLGSGIAPIPQMLAAGVRVGLGVDGSASNDASNMGREMQMALLVHRVGTGVEAMPPRRVLEMATRGGATILGQPEIGHIAPGAAADLAMFRLDRIDYAGAMSDPASAILFCGSGPRTEMTMVNGRIVVAHGELVDIDEVDLFHRANRLAEKMLSETERKTGMTYR
jgi:8-oxoguanine deaminase